MEAQDMANNLLDLVGDFLGGDPAHSLSDLKYNLNSLSIDFLPPLNVDLDIKNIPAIKTDSTFTLGNKTLPEVKISAGFGVTELPDIKANLTGNVGVTKLPKIDLVAALKELPKIVIDAGLDNLRVRELAPVNLQFSLKPSVLKLPFGYSFKVGVLGLNLLSFTMKGEVQAQLEDL